MEAKTKRINLRLHVAALFFVYVIIGGVFYFYPNLDLTFSGLFYSEVGGFTFSKTQLAEFLGYSSRVIVGIVLLMCMLLLIRKFMQTKSLKLDNYRSSIFIMMVFIVGPIMLVQFGLKNHSHRPRPYDIVEFAGENQFVSFKELGSGSCNRNCSFPSGHAAVGYACISFAFLPALRRYCTVLKVCGWVLGTLLGISRVMGGYHFLSDVLMSGFFIYLIIIAIFWCFYGSMNKHA